MKKSIAFIVFVVTLNLIACSDEPAVTPKPVEEKASLVNESTVYKVAAPGTLWTTSLNRLPVITRFMVTPHTVITLDSRPAHLDQLKPGFKVTIVYFNGLSCGAILPCYTAERIAATSIYTIQ